MIVWLASYPRSGNTLLRTVLKQTMDLSSYSDEIIRPIVGLTNTAKESFGDMTYEGSWDSFYHRASNSQDIVLVKTHFPPRDNQPAIYVVRDGRAATESYVAYHRSFIKDSKFCPSILSLMSGDDFYGDWSSHYQIWNSRTEGKLLLVRFEELVNVDKTLLEKLKMFVGFDGDVKLFENPREKLHLENPNFFRRGQTGWEKSSQWTGELESLFIALHGDLLCELGYISFSERDTALSKLDPMFIQLIHLAHRGFSERNSWHYEANEKEKVIKELLLELKEKGKSYIPEQSWISRVCGLITRSNP